MLWQGAAGLRQAIGIQIAGLFEDGQTAAERAWRPPNFMAGSDR
jgi:hypothetical protein